MKIILKNHKKGEKPNINVTVRRVEASTWNSLQFYKHHYLTKTLNPSCKCLLFEIGNEPIGFVGLLNTPRKGMPYGMSISRIVILPDYQGLGLSVKLCNFCGGIVTSLSDEEHDYLLYIKTVHTKMAQGLERSEKWIGTCFDKKKRTDKEYEPGKYNNRLNRISYCKKYEGNKIDGFQDLLLPIKVMRDKKREN